VVSGAARGKIGCEQGPTKKPDPQGANIKRKLLEQDKIPRPDPLLAEKGRR